MLTEKHYKEPTKDDLNYLINTLHKYTFGNSEHVKEIKEAMNKLKEFYKKENKNPKNPSRPFPFIRQINKNEFKQQVSQLLDPNSSKPDSDKRPRFTRTKQESIQTLEKLRGYQMSR